jgi:hypothetical protein
MLLSLTGASGVGKSTALDAIAAAFEGQLVSCVEFDSLGVPPGADTAWRHRVLERWVRRAVEQQREGRDLVLCGQVPVGELLAAPSPDALDGIAACLLHCAPEVRRERLLHAGRTASDAAHGRVVVARLGPRSSASRRPVSHCLCLSAVQPNSTVSR